MYPKAGGHPVILTFIFSRMAVKTIDQNYRQEFERSANHLIQSWEWGQFRQKEGKELLKIGEFKGDKFVAAFQLTFHPIPKTRYTIGYLPKSPFPSKEALEFLKKEGKKRKAIFVKIEPNEEKSETLLKKAKDFEKLGFVRSPKTIFTPNNLILDITKPEEDLLSKMHPKTRYNIRIAQKHGVKIEEREDKKSFEEFLKLQRETTKRQGFYTHPDSYFRLLWEFFKPKGMIHLLTATYKGKILAAWVLFRFKDTIYYPYGASSEKYKEMMASNLMMWEAIKFGKKLGCKNFDMWGALGENPNPKDPWFGFHRFKMGYSPRPVEYLGTYDLVINPLLYKIFLVTDKLRWIVLRILR